MTKHFHVCLCRDTRHRFSVYAVFSLAFFSASCFALIRYNKLRKLKTPDSE